MIDILPCKKCGIKPNPSCGIRMGKDDAYAFGIVECPKCGTTIKVLLSPDKRSFDALNKAIEQWNTKNKKPFRKNKKCKSCEFFVDVGYEGKKKCLRDGACSE